MRSIFFMISSIVWGCGDKNQGFGVSTGSTTTTDPSPFDTTEDTNNSDGTDTVETDVDSPTISNVLAYFASKPDGTNIIQVEMECDDPNDDILHGVVTVDYVSDTDSDSLRIDIDGNTTVFSEGILVFAFGNVDITESYDMQITLFDEANHPSNTVSASVFAE